MSFCLACCLYYDVRCRYVCFFMQKTAYEMRISDWSSDVCSFDLDHPVVKLAGLVDWSRFDVAFGRFYTQKGRPGLPTRLMAGLHLLKHMEGLSDEAVCAKWVENPY